jgi:ADP-heptose:LPS heptosyltransferase
MIALLAGARIVVGNDSGPLHVAVALERPIVGIYGPTDPRFVGPYGQLDHVVRFDVACHPCRRKTCDHHSCMRGVTVDAVWQCCRAVLAASESSVSKGSCE